LRRESDLARGADGDDLASMHSGTGAEVDDVIRGLDGLAIVLHHHYGVPHVAQMPERREEAAVVTRVESDRGLVEDVDDAGQLRANLAREPDALRFPAGERRGETIERKIPEPDVSQEPQAVDDLLQGARSR
jgi:hypothetical protein